MNKGNKIRVTGHFSRTHKNGKVFENGHHESRQFESENAPHIHKELSHLNKSWYNEKLSTEKDLVKFRRESYEKLFSKHIEERNAAAEKNRHHERKISIDSLINSDRTGIVKTLIYFGDKDANIPADEVWDMARESINKLSERYPQFICMDLFLHVDEDGAAHVHGDFVFAALSKDKTYAIPSQSKAFAQMGARNNKKRHDNAMRDMTADFRKIQIEVAKSHGYDVEITPQREKGGLELAEYKLQHVKEQVSELQETIIPQYKLDEFKKKVKSIPFSSDVRLSEQDYEDLCVTAASADYCRYLKYRDENKNKMEPSEKESMRIRFNSEMSMARTQRNSAEHDLQELQKVFRNYLEEKGLTKDFERYLASVSPTISAQEFQEIVFKIDGPTYRSQEQEQELEQEIHRGR